MASCEKGRRLFPSGVSPNCLSVSMHGEVTRGGDSSFAEGSPRPKGGPRGRGEGREGGLWGLWAVGCGLESLAPQVALEALAERGRDSSLHSTSWLAERRGATRGGYSIACTRKSSLSISIPALVLVPVPVCPCVCLSRDRPEERAEGSVGGVGLAGQTDGHQRRDGRTGGRKLPSGVGGRALGWQGFGCGSLVPFVLPCSRGRACAAVQVCNRES